MEDKKKLLINDYKSVCENLGRVPTIKEFQNLTGNTRRQVRNHFGTFTALQEAVGSTPEQDRDNLRNQILDSFLNMVRETGHVPTRKRFLHYTENAGRDLRTTFDSFEALEEYARVEHPEVFEDIIDDTNFTKDAFVEILKDVDNYKRFVITTAVTGCAPHEDGLEALQSYCRLNNAKLLILPCSDPAKTKTHKYSMSLDSRLPKDAVIYKDIALNSNLLISTIKLSAKQINPLTGLKRLGHKGSTVLASPKQMMIHVASSNKQGVPRVLSTTGAITVPDYDTEMYMSERTAYLAKEDHKLGALIVEIKDDDTFFLRRVEINSDTGSFCDLNKLYHANGKCDRIKAEVLNQPDWHTLSTDPTFRVAAKEITELMDPFFVTFEDFFDGYTINPHEKQTVGKVAKKFMNGRGLLSDELKECSEELNDILTWGDFRVVLKYGNHEDFLKRWLESGSYVSDRANHYEGVCLAKAMLEGEMPFEHAMRQMYPIDDQDRVRFLRVNDSFVVNGIENGVHGHLGSGGKKSPGLTELESYGPCTVGHSHSAGILREVVRVGVATFLQLDYNDGASAWTQTLNIQHYDGSRQLITVIEGEWCLPDILR